MGKKSKRGVSRAGVKQRPAAGKKGAGKGSSGKKPSSITESAVASQTSKDASFDLAIPTPNGSPAKGVKIDKSAQFNKENVTEEANAGGVSSDAVNEEENKDSDALFDPTELEAILGKQAPVEPSLKDFAQLEDLVEVKRQKEPSQDFAPTLNPYAPEFLPVTEEAAAYEGYDAGEESELLEEEDIARLVEALVADDETQDALAAEMLKNSGADALEQFLAPEPVVQDKAPVSVIASPKLDVVSNKERTLTIPSSVEKTPEFEISPTSVLDETTEVIEHKAPPIKDAAMDVWSSNLRAVLEETESKPVLDVTPTKARRIPTMDKPDASDMGQHKQDCTCVIQ